MSKNLQEVRGKPGTYLVEKKKESNSTYKGPGAGACLEVSRRPCGGKERAGVRMSGSCIRGVWEPDDEDLEHH